MKRVLYVTVAMLTTAVVAMAAVPRRAIVTESRGKVFVKISDNDVWQKCYTSMVLDENAQVRTERWSKAEIMLSDRSRIQVKSNSRVKLNSLSDENKVIEQQQGRSVFKITKLTSGRKFYCKTPVAVCSVRGTEFSVDAGDGNKSSFKVFSGLVDVDMPGGGQGISLRPNEKIDVMAGVPMGSPVPFASEDTKEKMSVSREALANAVGVEVGMDMTKEAIQRAAADEVKRAEYQNGKTIVDAFGKRVRIEEYIVRTAADQYKLVVLNDRKERFDYFTNIQTFNTALPTDLSVATKSWREWKDGAKTTNPTYFPKNNESAASNTADVVAWGYTGGDVVTVASGAKDIVYDNYYFKINNTNKIAYNPITPGANVTNVNTDVAWTVAGEAGTMTTAQFNTWWGDNVTASAPAGSTKMHSRLDTTFADGSTYREEYINVDDLGKIPSSSEYATNGVAAYNMEMVLSGSEFTGTESKIDLCVEPQIFIDAGLVAGQ